MNNRHPALQYSDDCLYMLRSVWERCAGGNLYFFQSLPVHRQWEVVSIISIKKIQWLETMAREGAIQAGRDGDFKAHLSFVLTLWEMKGEIEVEYGKYVDALDSEANQLLQETRERLIAAHGAERGRIEFDKFYTEARNTTFNQLVREFNHVPNKG